VDKNRLAAAIFFFAGVTLVFTVMMFIPHAGWKKAVMLPVLVIFLWKIAKAGKLV
jgi:uncharacterized membrane protein